MDLAPIILFVYNRPWHTEKTVEALKKNELADKSDLFIFSDGPKKENDENVRQVRDYIKTVDGFKSVTIFEREKNLGLAESVIAGVTEIVNKFGKVIVLEDDLVTSKYFLKFMNDGLEVYKYHRNVYAINGYMFPIDFAEKKVVLLPFSSTWGWGVRKEWWDIFKKSKDDCKEILLSKSLTHRFNLADYNYTEMLKIDENRSWGISYYYRLFVRNGLTVFPTKSLVVNIGFDQSGTNCGEDLIEQRLLSNSFDVNFENDIDMRFFRKFLDYFTVKTIRNSRMRNVLNLVQRSFSKINNLFKIKSVNSKSLHNNQQDLSMYFSNDFADILENWGEGSVWQEIQIFFAACEGKVLDVACGTGKVIEILNKNKRIDVHGFDISDLLINRAVEKGIDRSKLSIMDAVKTNYQDNEFDYSYSIGSLEHFTIEGLERAIAENYRYTKRISFHMVPVSRSGKDEGWMKTVQSFHNNSEIWWLNKFKAKYLSVIVINSSWNDNISFGRWFICYKE